MLTRRTHHIDQAWTTSRLQSVAQQRAMTLVELLLVMVLLVVVGSLSAPLFEGSFSSVRLRRGTDQILAAWSEARTKSIEAGEIYQFRFKPDGNLYRVERWNGGVPTAPLAATIATSTSTTPDEEQELLDWTLEEELPEQITFDSGEFAEKDESGMRQVAALSGGATSDWSLPILFYPDGRTSPASLVLKNSNNVYRKATLRALTGVGRASELLSREELDRQRMR